MPFGQGTCPTYPPLSWRHTRLFYMDDGKSSIRWAPDRGGDTRKCGKC